MEQEKNSDFIASLGDSVAAISKKVMAEDDAIYSSEAYINLIAEMITSIAEEFREAAEEIGINDELTNITLEEALEQFMQDERENNACGYLECAAEKMCSHTGAAYSIHGISAFCSLFFIAKNDLLKASQFFNLIIQPLMTAMRIDGVPREAGKKGGRPEHPRKAEAIQIGKTKWEQVEYASVNVVATTVKHQLDKKYTDAPSVAAIKKWLKSAGIAPNRSIK